MQSLVVMFFDAIVILLKELFLAFFGCSVDSLFFTAADFFLRAKTFQDKFTPCYKSSFFAAIKVEQRYLIDQCRYSLKICKTFLIRSALLNPQCSAILEPLRDFGQLF